jgi:type IV pilus assembly protein PilW
MLGVPVTGYSSSTVPGTCTTVTGAQTNSDVLVVRHANTCVTGTGCEGDTTANPDDGPHIQVSRCTTSAPPEAAYVIDPTTSPLSNKDCTTIADRRKVVSNIYFVSGNTLMRSALVDGVYATQPLIDGIEALRFEYGIDSTGDGSPDGSYLSAPPTTLADLRNIVAVKVHVLARNLEATPGYKDTKAYQLGNAATISAANDGFKRHVFSTTVRLVNPSGRREVP